jgi:hypothetical protein
MKPAQSLMAVVIVSCLLVSTFLLEASTNRLFESVKQVPSQSSLSTAGYGGLRIDVITMNDSSPTVSHLPITIRRGQIPTDNRLLLYAEHGGPVEVELPADASYLVEVSVAHYPVSVKVRVLSNELTMLKIWINQVFRKASSFELQDTDLTGRVAGWGDVFIKTGKIQTPMRFWNATTLVIKSDQFPPVPYSDVRLIQSEQFDVSILGSRSVGNSANLLLRPLRALQTGGISSVSFMAFASGHSVSYSKAWANSDHILRELIQDGPSGG